MQINFSTVSRVLYLIVTLAFMRFLAELAYGWSLGETEKFSGLIFGLVYARPASWAIQLGPSALFLLNGISANRRVKKVAFWSGIALNGVDGLTNLGAYITWATLYSNPNLHPFVQDLAYYIGILACFAVVWAEEIGVLLAGVVVYLAGELYYNFFQKRLPKWASVDAINLAEMASGSQGFGITLPRGEPSPGSTQNSNQNHGSQKQKSHQRPNNVTISQMPPDRQNNGRPSFSTHALREMELGDDEE